MNTWGNKLDLSDTFHNDALTVVEKTDTIVRRIKGASWYPDALEYIGFSSILEELEDAAMAGDIEWWDSAWDTFYDHADALRVWVITR